MRVLPFATAAALTAVSSIAYAAPTCNGLPVLSQAELAAQLGGHMVCMGSAGQWQNQEFHGGTTAGYIQDYKRGPSDPREPTTSTSYGSFSIRESNGGAASRGEISYKYAGGYSDGPFMVSAGGATGGGTAYYFCRSASSAGSLSHTVVVEAASLSPCK